MRLGAELRFDRGLGHRQRQHRMERKALGEQRNILDLFFAHQHDDLCLGRPVESDLPSAQGRGLVAA